MNIKSIRYVAFALVSLLLCLRDSALAVDGITLIHQTSTTVFPIVISTPGSYRLASDLRVTSTSADAINVNANNVTLDLNDFSIIGPGSGSGVGVYGFTATNVTVTNGAVIAMPTGIQLGDGAHVEGVRTVSGGQGILVNNYSRIIGNLASNSIFDGIDAGKDSLIAGNTTNSNTGEGIVTFATGTVIGNSASGNGGFGLDLDTKSGYGKNVLENNSSGCVSSGISMGDNICNGARQ